MKSLKIIVTAVFFVIMILPTISIAMDPNQMPNMDAGNAPDPAMMGNHNMDPQMMMQRQQMMGNPNMDHQMRMQRQQIMQRMMQMRQQNMPMYGSESMNGPPPSMCKHCRKGRKNSSKKINKQKMKQAHMKNMEKRLANIEALLQELVELQKKK